MADIQQVKLDYMVTPVSFEPEFIGLYFDPERKQENMVKPGEQKEKTFQAEFLPFLVGDKSNYNGVNFGGFFYSLRGSKLWGLYEAIGYYVASENNELKMICVDDRITLVKNIIAALGTQSKKPLHIIVDESFKSEAEDTKDLPATLAQVKQAFERYAVSRVLQLTLEGL